MADERVTVGMAIKQARRVSMRKLAAKADLSPAQISRIEADLVEQPAAETLVSIARALWQNPMPLLILGGHLPEDEARSWLLSVLQPESEVALEWPETQFEKARAVLADPDSPPEAMQRIAFDLFIGEPVTETEWKPSLALLAISGAHGEQRELITLFSQMTQERRERLLRDARDQVQLSRLELQREAEAALEMMSADDEEAQ